MMTVEQLAGRIHAIVHEVCGTMDSCDTHPGEVTDAEADEIMRQVGKILTGEARKNFKPAPVGEKPVVTGSAAGVRIVTRRRGGISVK
jgi:hypothetical protein